MNAPAPAVDADIHTRLRAGEFRIAFELLVPRYRDRVFRLCLSIVRERSLAEDTAQEIFIRIWRALPGYAAQSSLSTWIYAITRNACLSQLRKRRVHLSLDEPDSWQQTQAPVTHMPSDEAVTSVTQMLDRLPERYRRAVTLFYMEDKSYEQTAASLELPLGTVKALLHRARKRLIELAGEDATHEQPA
jgi:RNA polymerase sigma-70 factor, ECF subfamily